MNERVDPSGVGPEDAESKGAGLSTDEKFAKLVAEIDGTQVTGPAAKEESARTRELRAKWTKNPPQATPWRSDGPRADKVPSYLKETDPWGQPTQKSRGRRAKTSAKALIALALVGVIGYGFWPHHHPAAAPALDAAPAGTAAPWTASPSPSASPSPTFTNPDDEYFIGSKALEWADNENGIAIPKAAALHGVSASDIAAGYQLLEKVITAGNLDATILDGGPISDFTKLLDPGSKLGSQLDAWISKPSYQNDPTTVITRFNPATTRLLGHTVKVTGSMSAAAGPDSDTVDLTANYVFVYAVGPVADPSGSQTRVAVHRTLSIEVVNPSAGYQADPDKAWIDNYSASLPGAKCYTYDGYVEPDFDGSGAAPNVSGSPGDPYDTGNLLTPSAAQPSPTGTTGTCQMLSSGM